MLVRYEMHASGWLMQFLAVGTAGNKTERPCLSLTEKKPTHCTWFSSFAVKPDSLCYVSRCKTCSFTHFVVDVVSPVVEATLCSIRGRQKRQPLEQQGGTSGQPRTRARSRVSALALCSAGEGSPRMEQMAARRRQRGRLLPACWPLGNRNMA